MTNAAEKNEALHLLNQARKEEAKASIEQELADIAERAGDTTTRDRHLAAKAAHDTKAANWLAQGVAKHGETGLDMNDDPGAQAGVRRRARAFEKRIKRDLKERDVEDRRQRREARRQRRQGGQRGGGGRRR